MSKKYTHKKKIVVGAIQLNSTNDIDKNLSVVSHLIEALNQDMPDIIVLPEMFNYRYSFKGNTHYAESSTGKTVGWLKELAKKHHIWIIAGSITEKSHQDDKSYNTCFVISATGELISSYRKIHLFDVQLNNKKISESNKFLSGNSPTVVTINGWKIGLAICYDLRFPELFQYYFKQGVDAIAIPSSFTFETGEKHWHILCRARAIENQCYFIAPNQFGIGAGKKETYGHSLIIDPYGSILAEAEKPEEKVIITELNKETLENVRSAFPLKQHKRDIFN